MALNRAVWVTMGTAHAPGYARNVELWATRPRRGADGTIRGRLLASVCSAGFTRATGLTLKPGDEKKVRFAVTILE